MGEKMGKLKNWGQAGEGVGSVCLISLSQGFACFIPLPFDFLTFKEASVEESDTYDIYHSPCLHYAKEFSNKLSSGK